MIDLHAHTTASDGSFSPRELVLHARDKGLRAVGVTDHDTFGGWDEARAAGTELGVEIVPGIELSVSSELGKFHLLGYYVARDSELARVVGYLQDERNKRNLKILDNLNRLGLPLTLEEVRACAGEEAVLGRPHFAQAMMKRGYIASVKEAFDKYLADGGPAHASKQVLEPQKAVELIHAAGGVAIWAHPTRPPSTRTAVASWNEWEEHLQNWIGWGLDGLETYYSTYTPEEAAWTRQMVEKYGLLASGGSDFHGTAKPNVFLGEVFGGGVPDEILAGLKSKAASPLP